ncbi:RhaT Permeases of the drug/metabolite transporter (DMT) superfamily [Rhabdaerophilaceae bacterium]
MNTIDALPGPLRSLWNRPFFLMIFTTLFWGGNVVAGRLAVGEVSPMAIVFLRWLIAFFLLAAIAWRPISAEYRQMLPHWPMVLLMGVFGYTGFNALYYSAAHHTSATNIAIIQGSTPIVILLLGLVVFRNRLTVLQLVGAILTMIGVFVCASRGAVSVITTLDFNRGDLWLLIASIMYAFYTLLLRKRPACSPLTFFAAMAAGATLSAIPLLAYEVMQGKLLWPGLKGWLIIAYIAILPSLLCQIAYIRGVELLGAGRASIFYNLVPIFGVFLAALLLWEWPTLTDVIALALVIGGILVAERDKGDGKA